MQDMPVRRKRALAIRRSCYLWILLALTASIFPSCSLKPTVRRLKYYRSGQEYLEKKKYREAAIQFENATLIDPQFAEAHLQLARCYLKLGTWSSAASELYRTIEIAPNDWKAHIELGNLLLAGQELVKAGDEARLVLANAPNIPDAHALMANVYASAGKQAEALKEMQEALRLAPGRPQFCLNMAMLQADAGLFTAAEESFKRAVSLDSKSAAPLVALASFYAQRQRFDEAEQRLRQAAALEPKAAEPRAALARLYLAQGQKNKAEEALKEGQESLRDNPDGYCLLADFYLSTGDSEKGFAGYASLYQAHPQNLQVEKKYVQLLLLHDQVEEATKLNDEILRKNPSDADALVVSGEILERQGKANQAVHALQQAVLEDDSNAAGHYYLGVALGMQGHLARAEAEWREAARLRPGMVEAQQALAASALSRHDYNQLKECAIALIAAAPASPEGYVYSAIAKAEGRDIAGAKGDLSKAMDVAPRNPLGYTGMGELQVAQRSFQAAEGFFERALQLDPNASEALTDLANLYVAQKELPKALQRVNAQLGLAPNNDAYYTLLGRLYFRDHELPKAEAALERATKLNKNNRDAFLLLGQVQVAEGSVDRAIASYQRFLSQDSHDARIPTLLGTLEESKNDWPKAEEWYRAALRIDPDYPLAANNLAYLMLEHGGNPDEIMALAQTGRRGLPNSPHTADTLAWAYFMRGSYNLSIELLEESVKAAPDNPTYHYHLGLAYQRADSPALAKEHFRRALHLNPNYAHADAIQQALTELTQAKAN